MFDQLPETIPHKNKKKLEAFAAAFTLQMILVAGLIILQMAMPEKLGEFQLLTTLYMAAPPPPPPAPLSEAPRPQRHVAEKAAVAPTPAVVEQAPPPVEKPEMTAPVTIPKDIAKIVDTRPPAGISRGASSGVESGVSDGLLGGVLGGAGSVPP